MQPTSIEWTDFTSNPVKFRDQRTNKIVWACAKVSPGCVNCYAESIALRFKRGGPFTKAEVANVKPFLDEDEMRQLLTSKKIAGKRVFLQDMSDLFGDWVSDDLLNRLFSECLERRTDVTFQILTKRAERMQKYMAWRWGEGRIPCRHIHFGVSVENQEQDWRIVELLRAPVAVRFLSCEPLLGPLDLRSVKYLNGSVLYCGEESGWEYVGSPRQMLSWGIIGCESGRKRRTMQSGWARTLKDDLQAARVPVFMKQMEVNGKVTGNIEDFPEDLRTRQYPERA